MAVCSFGAVGSVRSSCFRLGLTLVTLHCHLKRSRAGSCVLFVGSPWEPADKR